MPYICVNTPAKMSDSQKVELKTRIGEKISIINGKVEARLMVQVNDECDLFFAGEQSDEIAFVEIRLFRQAEFCEKQKFIETVFDILNDMMSINKAKSFMSVTEHLEWGSNGTLAT